MIKPTKLILRIFLAAVLVCLGLTAFGQTASFTYQGKLSDNNLPASGSYQMQFGLFDAASGGTQIGATQTEAAVAITSGSFAVELGFGAAAFNGADRYLEIRVFSPATNAFVVMTPRQRITSAPYSVRSLNAATADVATNANSLGGAAANQFVVNADPRLTDARPPTANNSNYIQNTNVQQASSNFNISGTGSAAVINATAQYNIGGNRALSTVGTNNVFVGVGAGSLNTTGNSNAFFGRDAGKVNTTGSNNSFIGRSAGDSNTTGSFNSFYGTFSGAANTTGNDNSFFGVSAGSNTIDGINNSFFGRLSGVANVSGVDNSFFGMEAGRNTISDYNSFFGKRAGYANTTGFQNSFFGNNAGGNNISGVNNAFFGDGAGGYNTTGKRNTFIGRRAGDSTTTGESNTAVGFAADTSGVLTFATAIGAESLVAESNSIALGRPGGFDKVRVYGQLVVGTLAVGAATTLCKSPANYLAECSSSLRYKSNISTYKSGLSFINSLRPVTFDWKESHEKDLGLIAEEVAEIEPLLVTRNKDGEIQGVKYDRIGVVLLNAVREQQTQIQKQQEQIEVLKQLVCEMNAQAAVCTGGTK